MARRKKKALPLLENIEINAVAAEGKSLARHNGQVIFVADAAPGDVVDIQLTRDKKKFFEGRIVNFHQYSSLRAEPFCQHYELCGGCKWQHIDYAAQLKFKEQQVHDQLSRIGKIDLPSFNPIAAAPQTRFYRNKLEFSFSNRRWLLPEEVKTEIPAEKNALGFHMAGRFDRILDITECHLQPDPSNAIRNSLREYALAENLPFYDPVEHQGFMRNVMIRSSNTGGLMVVVQFARPRQEDIEGVLEHLKRSFPQITSLQYIVNQKLNDTIYDQEVICYSGHDFIEEEMEGLRFRVSAKSFFQTNSEQAYTLYKFTRDFARLTGTEVVYDLYTGTGTIAQFVARQARQVIGIESVPEAIEDAKANAERNGLSNLKFYAGDMRNILTDDFVAEHGKPDVIITDPPRAGMHPDVVNTILNTRPDRIVYVSCNPATQARDLQLLDSAYKVTAVQPVDMFPHTHHIENIVLINKRAP
jgi:23S rRNA (uracil1939-C5)-methyltransferase